MRLRADLVATLGYQAAAAIVAHELAHLRLSHSEQLEQGDTPEQRARCEAEADAMAAKWLGPGPAPPVALSGQM